jgi:HTH-type transcriptional repressor of NAD biosynthesis genes
MSAAPRWRLGLVVGKFSPLHLGHELLIEHAMAHCRRVLVLGYSKPELPGCSAARRQQWVQRRFPQVLNVQLDDVWVQRRCQALGVPELAMPPNTAPDAEQQNWLAWLLDSLLQLRPDAMFASEPYVHPTCERLSQQFGHPVVPVLFDPTRRRIGARASTIRQDVHRHRHALHPEVYQDFVLRVAVLGAESSGKTTLTRALAVLLRTKWVPEYGRELWEVRRGQLTLEDLIEIAHTQVQRETQLCSQASRVVFCDTTPLTTLGYAGWMFGTAPTDLLALAARPYDFLVLCEPDFGFVQDGTRQSAEFQGLQHAWYLQQLSQRREPQIRVRGALTQRLKQVVRELAGIPAFRVLDTSGADACRVAADEAG